MNRSILFLSVLSLLSLSISQGQVANANPETKVLVEAQYVSKFGLDRAQLPEHIDWEQWSRSVVESTTKTLAQLKPIADQYGHDRVANLVTTLVGIRVFQDTVIRYILSLLFCAFGEFVCFWTLIRFFTGRRVLIKDDKVNKVREWRVVKYHFACSEARSLVAAGLIVFFLIWTVFWAIYLI